MSESEISVDNFPVKEYETQLFEVMVGEDSWIVLSNSYAEVARYVDFVFRLQDLPALKIRRLELFFRVLMDTEPGNTSMMTQLFLATVRDQETDTEDKVLANSIKSLLAGVEEKDIVQISLYTPRAVVLKDVKVVE
jgi:hypothetical protein